MEIEVYLHTFLNVGTILGWVESFTIRPLCRLGQNPWFLFGRTDDIDRWRREKSLNSCWEVAWWLTRMQEFCLRLCLCVCGGGWDTSFKWALDQEVWKECTSTPKGYVKPEICVVHLKHRLQHHKNSLCSTLLTFLFDCKTHVNIIVMHKNEVFLSNTCTPLIYILTHILASICLRYWSMFLIYLIL